MNPNTLHEKQKKQMRSLYYAALILLLPISTAFYFISTQQEEEINHDDSFLYETMSQKSISLQDTQTEGYAVFVLDLNTEKILYEKNSDILLPLASITKLVTAKVAEDFIDSPVISISKMKDFPQYGDMILYEGQKWNTKDLITYTLLTSSNDGAHSLLTNTGPDFSFFTQKMNQVAASAGLVETYFYNETGLDNDDEGIPGSKGTAKEVAYLLEYLLEEDFELFEKTRYTETTIQTPQGTQIAQNTNILANQIIGLMLSKTGYTDLAGGNLAIIADMGLNDPVAFVVLRSSRESRFRDILQLQEEYFAQVRESLR